jgi:2-haloalkanoic acid dehalogenase type II
MSDAIKAIVFDCYGTIIDFGDDHFARAYGEICAAQGIEVEGKVFFDKWMEVWRRLAQSGAATDGGTVGIAGQALAGPNQPGPLSEAEQVPPHPQHHTPSAGRSRSLNGPLPPFRPYSEEWPEHFDLCFEELGLKGNARAAYEQLVVMLGRAEAFPETRRVVEEFRSRMPVGLLSNADDNFLVPALEHNKLSFPVVVSSESTRAYKPHIAIFQDLGKRIGLPLESILYVGDSRLADIAGAKNAGMKAAWVNRKGARALEAVGTDPSGQTEGGETPRRPRRQDLPSPDFEVASLDELVGIVLEQSSR